VGEETERYRDKEKGSGKKKSRQRKEAKRRTRTTEQETNSGGEAKVADEVLKRAAGKRNEMGGRMGEAARFLVRSKRASF
jgi:hypothetical protein